MRTARGTAALGTSRAGGDGFDAEGHAEGYAEGLADQEPQIITVGPCKWS